MHIYIDETGVFANPLNKPNDVSCVGALIVPNSQKDQLISEFVSMRSNWTNEDEIKGGDLTHKKIRKVILLLKRYDVIFEICGIDLGHHTDDEITVFKKIQSEKFLEHVTGQHQPMLKKQLRRLKSNCLNLHNQLFVQSVVLSELIHHSIQMSTMSYCQFLPTELGEFHWVIDRKDRKITDYEKFWSSVIKPYLQAASFKDPLIQIEGMDYSSFEKYCGKMERPPEHLRTFSRNPDKEMLYIDVNQIMDKSLVFQDSKQEPGLQLVDILLSAFSRAIKGELPDRGWEDIGSLMLLKQGGKPLTLLALSTSYHQDKAMTFPYDRVLKKIQNEARHVIR